MFAHCQLSNSNCSAFLFLLRDFCLISFIYSVILFHLFNFLPAIRHFHLTNCASSIRRMLAFRDSRGVFHPEEGFELTFCLLLSLKVLVWEVKDLVFVFVNSFVSGLDTVFLQDCNTLSLFSVLMCMTVRISNNFRHAKVYLIWL